MRAVSDNCFVCENCISSCPVNAININGASPFEVKAFIDEEKCIHCGRCEAVCPALNIDSMPFLNSTEAYGFVSRHEEAQKSTSGGAFFELAKRILLQGGCVAGAAWSQDWLVTTQIVSDVKDLEKLQGSKYVKCYNRNAFPEIKQIVKSGRKFLFGGTPCQIAALYQYLGNNLKKSDNLLTVDLVCHGCPPGKLFQDYIVFSEEKHRYRIVDFRFRAKRYGSKLVGKIKWQRGKRLHEQYLYAKESSYFKLFLDSETYLENCYSCPFARNERIADLTISDFWGWKQECYQKLLKKGVTDDDPVSAVLIHTEKGKQLFEQIKNDAVVLSVAPECVIKHNPNLSSPSKYGRGREEMKKMYAAKRYAGIEEFYHARNGLKRYSTRIECMMPNSIKRAIKKYVLHI